ncbi:conserved membrane hypothetical protein [metagenome]|uniref:Integral membrane protein n=1 Tax=metagenome TaxID=256318 RepID=A0A2P2BVV8_9ZZZZ
MADAGRTRQDAESWFVGHGLPYFVDHLRHDVRRRLSRGRLTLVGALSVLVGVGVGVLLGLSGATGAPLAGVSAALLVCSAYALRALKVWMIARWAIRRTLGSLGLLVPLATRALPMLLLFMTFLFINTEVWQVASSLDGAVLGGAVLVFAVVAVGFLLGRLGEELDQFDDDITPTDVREHCQDTPFGDAEIEVAAQREDLAAAAQVTGLQKANLVLMLLVAQAVQVLLLVLAVFAFFVVFGAVAIDAQVIESWIGTPPTYLFGARPMSRELLQVATFLSAFSGLYFTVYAVTDSTYRQQFFTAIMRELGQVVSARVVYRSLIDRRDD